METGNPSEAKGVWALEGGLKVDGLFERHNANLRSDRGCLLCAEP